MKISSNGEFLRSPAVIKISAFIFMSFAFFYLGKHWSDNGYQQLIFFTASTAPATITLSPNYNKPFNISSLISQNETQLDIPINPPSPAVVVPPPPPALPPPPSDAFRSFGIVSEDGTMSDKFEVGEFDPDLVEEWGNGTEIEEGKVDGGDSRVKMRFKKFGLCPVSMKEYIPCLDNVEAIKKLNSTERGERFERHCPEKDKGLYCLVPPPKGYRPPIAWPKSRDEVWFSNVPHTRLVEDKGGQNWLNHENKKDNQRLMVSFLCLSIGQHKQGRRERDETRKLFVPEKGGTMSMDLNDYTIIREGEAEILMHAKNEVFYNKTQVNNRDMSIAVLRAFISRREQEHEARLSRRRKSTSKVFNDGASGSVVEEAVNDSIMTNEKTNGECEGCEEISEQEPYSRLQEPGKTPEGKVEGKLELPRVLEALSASGLRSLRYAREVEGIGRIVALDNDKASVEACRRNIKFNGSVACSKVESQLVDVRIYMLTHPKEFDVVDLDPYGSPSVFLDSAVQSVVDGGMLMCTATDMAVLCGSLNGEVCYSKYGSYPLRGKYCHEMAIRILLACIESHANRYKCYIVPVLSVQMDFYVRVFVRIYTSASAMKNTPLKLSYLYQCTGCDSFHLQPIGRTLSKNNSIRYLPGFGPVVPQECSDCGKKFNMGGPIWSSPIHDQEWVTSILVKVKSMKERYPAFDPICAVLTMISEELPDVPLFLSLHITNSSDVPICCDQCRISHFWYPRESTGAKG